MREQGLRTVTDRQQEIALGLAPGALTPAHKEQVATLGLQQRLGASIRTTQADYWARKRGTLNEDEQSFDMRLVDAVTAAMLDPDVTDDDELVASLRRVKVAGAPDTKRDGITMTVDPKTQGTKFRMWNEATKRYNYRSASKLSPMLTTAGRAPLYAEKALEVQAAVKPARVPTVAELYAERVAPAMDDLAWMGTEVDINTIHPRTSPSSPMVKSQPCESGEEQVDEDLAQEQRLERERQEAEKRARWARDAQHEQEQVDAWDRGELSYGDLDHRAQRSVAAVLAGRDVDPALWDRLSDTEITRRVDAVQARLLEAEQQAAEPETDQPPEQPRAVAVRSDGAGRGGEFAVRFPRGEYPRGVEMLALVREHADGGAYVDYQVAAGDPVARGQVGLHLQARRVEGLPTRTAARLTAEQYARLQAAAGSNRVEVRGVSVLAVRGDVTVTRSGGYTLSLRSVEPSRRGTISTDVLERQRAVEDKARASRQEHVRQQRALALETAEREGDQDL